jgi:uncharacterized membrane protein YhiD involved in acid resistance
MLFGVIFVTCVVLISIWFGKQMAQINANRNLSAKLETQNILLKSEIDKTNDIITQMQQFDVDQQKALKLFEEYYARDLENQKILNDNFVTDEKLNLQVEKVVDKYKEDHNE